MVAGLDDRHVARGWPEPVATVRRLVSRLSLGSIASSLEAERARWFAWLPVLFGGGVVAYFHLSSEPGLMAALAGPVMAAAFKAAWRRGLASTVVTGAVLSACLGFAFAKARTEWVRAPVLARTISSADVRGYVTLVEPRTPRGQRITLRVTSISGLAAGELPRAVRIRTMRALPGLAPGDAMRIRARLSPPAEPSLPGDYDFARAAWYSGLGAIGFALKAPEIDSSADPPASGLGLSASIERLRQGIGARIIAVLPGETGAIANSLITGERGGISEETTDAFRDSGLLHILSISGLHMVIMAGAVFVALRMLAAAFPSLALRYPTKKWAAGAALLAAFGYLLISGSSVATVRSFIMIAIMFLAVMVDRPAIAMRNVALAAMLILAVTPEAVLDVGFQMSFAAVVSLVAVYEVVRERVRERERAGALSRVAFFLGGIVFSTVIASVAVAPFAAYHFHRSQQFALIANLIAIPICNLLVMPAGLLTLLLMPLGLEALPLTVMAWGIDVMVWAATWVASLPGAVVHIPAMADLAFGLMIAGGLWLALWQTRWRMLGAGAVAAGLALAPTLKHPDVIAGLGGSLVAVRGPDGKLEAMSARGGNFELKRWLEHDGDAREASDAAGGHVFRCDGSGCTATVKGALVAVARHPSAFTDDCVKARVVVAPYPAPEGCKGPAAVVDFPALRREGTHALYFDDSGAIRIDTVAARRGDRPWSAKPRSSAKRQRRRPPVSHSITTDEAHEATLDVDLIRPENARLVIGVRGLERDRRTLLAQALQGRLLALDEGHDNVAVLGRVAAAHDHGIAVVDAGLDHRVALHLEREVLAVGQQVGRAGDVVRMVLDGADRHAGGNATHDGHRDGAGVDDMRRRQAEVATLRSRTFDDARLEAAAPLRLTHACAVAGVLGQFQDLDGAGTVGKAADEAALDQRGDEPMDAGFRLEIERILHLVERGRHPVGTHALVDEEQEFFLLLGQHQASASGNTPHWSFSTPPEVRGESHAQSMNVRYPFPPCSASGWWCCPNSDVVGKARGSRRARDGRPDPSNSLRTHGDQERSPGVMPRKPSSALACMGGIASEVFWRA